MVEAVQDAATGARRVATWEDLQAVPEHKVGELIDGELFVMSRPALRHASTGLDIAMDLSLVFGRRRRGRGPDGWIILPEPELHLGVASPRDRVVVPDIAGWRRTRMPELPDVAAVELPPDWLCEVLSPSTERHDRSRKMEVYADAGVEWVWLVDPRDQTIEVFRLGTGGWWSRHPKVFGDAPARIPPFDDEEFDVRLWWPEGTTLIEDAPAKAERDTTVESGGSESGGT